MCVLLILMRATRVRIRLLVNFFFSPFSNHTRKAFIFNKNEGNNPKVEIEVSGRVRVGVGRALLSQNKVASI